MVRQDTIGNMKWRLFNYDIRHDIGLLARWLPAKLLLREHTIRTEGHTTAIVGPQVCRRHW